MLSNIMLIKQQHKTLGSGALSGKMLLVRIIENNRIDAYSLTLPKSLPWGAHLTNT